MGNQKPNDLWEGLDPDEQSGRLPTGWLIGGAVAIGLLLCGLLAFFLWQQFRPDTPADGVSQPTATATVLAAATATETAVTATPASSVSNVIAAAVGTPPTIDGSLDDWPGTRRYTSAFRVFTVAGWDGSDDLTAVWQLAWDQNNLYVAVDITDDIHVQTQTGNQIFRGDSVDIQFDTERDSDFGDGLSPDDFQITLSPGDFAGLPPAAFRFQGTVDGRILDAPGGHSVRVAAAQTAVGYTLEAAIPWTNLAVSPAAGLRMGIALNANDNDSPGTAVQEVMMSHVSTRTLTNPTTWGTLQLES